MTILNPKITEDGYVEGYAYDMYNFDHLDPDGSEAVKYNNYAFELQKANHLYNYYILVPIRVKIK